MMMTDDRHNWIGKINRRQDVRAYTGVKFHFLEFGRGQLTWFVQDVLWNRELSHVVEQRSCFYCLNEFLIRDSDVPCETNGVDLDSSNVTMSDLVFCIDRHRQRFNRGKIKLAKLAHVSSRVVD